jgi:hypothetical protein
MRKISDEIGAQSAHLYRRIYETADETIVYLNGSNKGNAWGCAWNYLERNSSWALNEEGEKDYQLPSRANDLTNFRGDLHDVYAEVLSKEWFTRVWVLQEFVVSKKVSFQSGGRRVHWETSSKP